MHFIRREKCELKSDYSMKNRIGVTDLWSLLYRFDVKSTDGSKSTVTDILIYLWYFCLQLCYITTQYEMNVDHILITLPTHTCLINKLFAKHHVLEKDTISLYIFLLKKKVN